LQTKLVVFPVVTLLIVILISGYLISQKVNRALENNERAQIAQLSGMFAEVFQSRIRSLQTVMRVAVLQKDLYEGYFDAVTGKGERRLEEFAAKTMAMGDIDAILISNEKMEIVHWTTSDWAGDFGLLAELLERVLGNAPIMDKTVDLDEMVQAKVLRHGSTCQLITVGPVLDVGTSVGAVVFLEELDEEFLANQKHYFENNVELTIAASDRILASTLAGWSLPGQAASPSQDFAGEVGGRPFRHRFAPVPDSEVFLALSYDVSENQAARSSISRIMLCVLVGALAVVAGIILLSVRRIVESVRKLAGYSELVSAGDLTAPVEDLGEDEVGRMAKAFGGMVDSLRKMIGRVVGMSADLATEADNLSAVTTQMASANAEVSTETQHVASTSEEMGSDMATAAASVGEVSEKIVAIAAAAQQLNAIVGEISRNAEAVRDVTTRAVSRTERASTKVGKLVAATAQIDHVTATIAEIADQTKLLALNATIEAARAGDVGKGFAVVAGEVKELARQTVAAVEEIAERNRGIQESTSGTIAVIEQVSEIMAEVDDVVATIARAVKEQASSTNDIAVNVAEASGETQRAADSAQRISANLSNMSANIGRIAGAAEQNTAAVGTVAVTADSVARKADTLRTLTERFRT
jgi:methyl-accepting chemotaxis protein